MAISRMLPDQLTEPTHLFSRAEVLDRPWPVPAVRGVYAWYFHDIPNHVPTQGCVRKCGHTLLYIGISPSRDTSRANLRKRIHQHFTGNAKSSTLRLTLGVLLSEASGFPLRRVGSGARMTFTRPGEQWLDQWMAANARVCWVDHERPWLLEEELLNALSPPLNIRSAAQHPFAADLSKRRVAAKDKARSMSIAEG